MLQKVTKLKDLDCARQTTKFQACEMTYQLNLIPNIFLGGYILNYRYSASEKAPAPYSINFIPLTTDVSLLNLKTCSEHP